jgi:hypothetical protein
MLRLWDIGTDRSKKAQPYGDWWEAAPLVRLKQCNNNMQRAENQGFASEEMGRDDAVLGHSQAALILIRHFAFDGHSSAPMV